MVCPGPAEFPSINRLTGLTQKVSGGTLGLDPQKGFSVGFIGLRVFRV